MPEPAHGAPAGGGTGVHAGVRVGVDQQDVAGAADGRQQRDVGVDPRRGEHGGLGAVVVGELLLQREVQAGGAVEHAAAGGAGAELAERGRGRLDHPGVAGEAEVVVAAEVDPVPAVVVERDRLRGAAGRDGVRGRRRPACAARNSAARGFSSSGAKGSRRPGTAQGADLARGLPSRGAGSPGCTSRPGCAATERDRQRRVATIGSSRDRGHPVSARPGSQTRTTTAATSAAPAVNTAVTCMAETNASRAGSTRAAAARAASSFPLACDLPDRLERGDDRLAGALARPRPAARRPTTRGARRRTRRAPTRGSRRRARRRPAGRSCSPRHPRRPSRAAPRT